MVKSSGLTTFGFQVSQFLFFDLSVSKTVLSGPLDNASMAHGSLKLIFEHRLKRDDVTGQKRQFWGLSCAIVDSGFLATRIKTIPIFCSCKILSY